MSFARDAMQGGTVAGMQSPLEKAIARRLKAVREELKLDAHGMANYLGVGRTRYLNWERADNLPSELHMIALANRTGLTLDYIYRGVLDAVPMALAIRVAARERGLDPDAPGFQPEQALGAIGVA